MGGRLARKLSHPGPSVDGSQTSLKKRFMLKTSRKMPLTSPPPLTSEQTETVVQSWARIKDKVADVGVVAFVGLFETHPDVQDLFYHFKGVAHEDLRLNQELKAHGLRVLATVDKCISRIHDPEKMASVLVSLGRRHKGYSSKPEYMDFMAPQLLHAVLGSLPEDQVNAETEEAWNALIKLICYYIKKGLIEEECQT